MQTVTETAQETSGLEAVPFVSQRDARLETPIQRSICGAASLAMALAKAGYHVDLVTLLHQIIEVSSADVPTSYWKTGRIDVPVTYDPKRILNVDQLLDATQLQIQALGGNAHRNDLYIKYQARGTKGGFNLKNGFDYRLLPTVFAKYYPNLTQHTFSRSSLDQADSSANFYQNWEQIKHIFTAADASLLISVKFPAFGRPWRAAEPQSRHIIFVSDIEWSDAARSYLVRFCDPASHDEHEGQCVCSLEYLAQNFCGNMSIIYPTPTHEN